MAPLIAMITDFGLRDPFAGIMKGVIRRLGSTAEIIDITHGIKQGDIKSAGFALSMSFEYFPEGTIFLAVVDPGVGTDRRPVAVEIGGRMVVCPDNGMISFVIQEHPKWRAIHINHADCFLPYVSSTFHGRDVFAPTAAHISMGVPFDDIGSLIDDIKTIPVPEVTSGEHHIQGEVVYIDGFGNLVTNISEKMVMQWAPDVPPHLFRIHTGSVEISGISAAYSAAGRGFPLAVFGSSRTIEIAVNGGSAAVLTGNGIGANVLLYK